MTMQKIKAVLLLVLFLGTATLFAAIGMQGERYAISGIEYYQRGDYSSAITDFQAANRSADGKVPRYHYWLGRLYIAQGDITNAVGWLNRYIASGDKEFRQETQDYLRIINRQDRIFEKVSLRPMASYLQSRNSDYGAVVSPDGNHLYYTSLSPTRAEKENIWRSERLATGWGRPYPVVELNTDKNESLGSFSLDGNTAYLFGNYKRGQIDGDIFTSTLLNGKWSAPVPIEAVNTPQVEAHPYVYRDSLMFFTSSREGGYGEFDLYVSENRNGEWQEPINLGPQINTPGSEQTPFLDYDGRNLFFASDHHPGFGGYDLFKAVKLGEGWQDWSQPENLGLPINSIRNDRFFYHTKGSNEALFSTDRQAAGFEKMMNMTLVYTVPPSYIVEDESGGLVTVIITPEGDYKEGEEPAGEKPVSEYVTVSGKLTDENGKPLQGTIEFTANINDMVYRDVAFTDKNGEFRIALNKADKYNVLVNQEGYLVNAQILIPGDRDELTLNIVMRELKEHKVFAFQNIQFNFDSSVLKQESFAVLDEVVVTLLTNPHLKLEVSGHTCSIGEEEYNLSLSKRRANAVYDYLVLRGVEKVRLSHTGYGEEKPLNENENPEQRELNRRVEFKVIK
ncbi:MAG: OmpA family protein [Candidatus Cloacimonetes bacterium]|nr:OmpA family protein [Candidatus Cloacimonadota bacterium]MDY0172063.1 OmpA family protein [Candidatus Cloacimonadaceae bacterium]